MIKRIIKILEFFDNIQLWGAAILLILGGVLVHHFWYSISVTHDLKYPENPQRIYLAKQLPVIIERGVFKEVD